MNKPPVRVIIDASALLPYWLPEPMALKVKVAPAFTPVLLTVMVPELVAPAPVLAKARRTARRIASGDTMRPEPSSPQARSPSSVGSTSTPRSASTRRFSLVAACSFMAQFMAGATIVGPRKAR